MQENKVSYGLTIFDIDDTLFKTDNKVYIIKNKRIRKKISSAEYAAYKLKEGETFDFREFRDSKLFFEQARPIKVVLKKLKATAKRIKKRKYSEIIFVTARKNMNNKKLFLETFREFGIDIDSIYIERAGNLNLPVHEAKKKIITQYLKKKIFERVRLYDDQIKNLQSFFELKEKFPKIFFAAYLIKNKLIKRVSKSSILTMK